MKVVRELIFLRVRRDVISTKIIICFVRWCSWKLVTNYVSACAAFPASCLFLSRWPVLCCWLQLSQRRLPWQSVLSAAPPASLNLEVEEVRLRVPAVQLPRGNQIVQRTLLHYHTLSALISKQMQDSYAGKHSDLQPIYTTKWKWFYLLSYYYNEKKKKKELHVISGQISFSHPYNAENKQ